MLSVRPMLMAARSFTAQFDGSKTGKSQPSVNEVGIAKMQTAALIKKQQQLSKRVESIANSLPGLIAELEAVTAEIDKRAFGPVSQPGRYTL
ncbi:hypothetical protein [Pseudomonas phage phiZ98]|nr:hypothetical protein [Pseudomonas phage phiZ98]